MLLHSLPYLMFNSIWIVVSLCKWSQKIVMAIGVKKMTGESRVLSDNQAH